jgi:DNA-binding transcriptional regulator YiaG
MQTFSPRKMRALREGAGLSRARLAFAVGRGPDAVRDWERGKFIPNGASMLALIRVLECSLDDLTEEVSS